MCASAIPVAETISEMMERMSSVHGFGHNITENIKQHLSAMKEKCSGSDQKLDLNDPATRKWVGQVTDLFHLVDDLSAEAALLSRQSKMVSACKLKLLLRLKKIEKWVVREVAPMKNVKMLPNEEAEDEEGQEAEAVVQGYAKERVINCILRKEEGVKVEAVVVPWIEEMAMARVAKYVCEDERVKSGFDVVKWFGWLPVVYAGYVEKKLNKELEEKRKNRDCGDGERKGFFVVLKDFSEIFSRNEFKSMVEKLKGVCGGGALLICTTIPAVAELVRSTFEKDPEVRFDWFHLSHVLFEKIAGASGSAIESQTRERLLKMCGGVPEVIETMARLVRSRNPTTESDIDEVKHEFVKKMVFRYCTKFGLSSWRLRQCFAYSLLIIPSEYDSVNRETLVRLWMAEGFLGHSSASSSKEPEDLGYECIDELLRRSLFCRAAQDAKICGTSKGSVLGSIAVGKYRGYVEYRDTVDKDVWRVMLSSKSDVSKGIPRPLLKSESKNMRTFLLENEAESRPPNLVMLNWYACDEIVSAFTRLHVLTLKDLGIKVLPDSIGNLMNLRYLDLSRNSFHKLPICIGEMQHLQTLLLSHCYQLRQLPDDINHFPSLRHLELNECRNLIHMPSALKRLTWLRSLPHFVASSRNGVAELIHLNNLRPDLEISHLERFIFKGSHSHSHARAYLKQKQHLRGLTLRWNHLHDDDKHNYSHETILQRLEPHPNLERLSVLGYQGNQFPSWLLSLTNLVEITLYDCSKCQYLPIEDTALANLKTLTLVSLSCLQYITVTDKDNGCEKLQLQKVKIWDCPNLRSWWKNPGMRKTTNVFSAVSELAIVDCPKLDSMPLFPDLEDLVLDSSNMEPLLNTLRYKSDSLSKLEYLTLVNVDEKQYPLKEELFKNFTSLKVLQIRDCKALRSIRGWKHLASLKYLYIYNCTDIDITSEELQGLVSLKELAIGDMPYLKSLPQGIEHLFLLSTLKIKNCSELMSITYPNPNLWFLSIEIEYCPKLASLPERSDILKLLRIKNCPLLEAEIQRRRKSSIKTSSGVDQNAV